jgi:hypothetical protein
MLPGLSVGGSYVSGVLEVFVLVVVVASPVLFRLGVMLLVVVVVAEWPCELPVWPFAVQST